MDIEKYSGHVCSCLQITVNSMVNVKITDPRGEGRIYKVHSNEVVC